MAGFLTLPELYRKYDVPQYIVDWLTECVSKGRNFLAVFHMGSRTRVKRSTSGNGCRIVYPGSFRVRKVS